MFYFAHFDAQIKTWAAHSLEATKGLLAFIQEAEASTVGTILISSFIPKTVTDAIPEFESILAKAISTLMSVAEPESDNEKVISEFVKWFVIQPALMKNALAQKLAAVILAGLAGDKIKTEEEAQSIVDAWLHGTKFTS